MENKVDRLYVDKLVPFPVDLSKLSHVVKNDVVKKDAYNSSLNAKINEVKGEIPSTTNLVTTAALTNVEKKYA